jgi:hypothetical protein
MRTRSAPELGTLRPRMRTRLVPALSAGTLPPQVNLGLAITRHSMRNVQTMKTYVAETLSVDGATIKIERMRITDAGRRAIRG